MHLLYPNASVKKEGGFFYYSFPQGKECNYYITGPESAKTEQTRTKRIAQVVTSFVKGIDFGEMMRMNRDDKL